MGLCFQLIFGPVATALGSDSATPVLPLLFVKATEDTKDAQRLVQTENLKLETRNSKL